MCVYVCVYVYVCVCVCVCECEVEWSVIIEHGMGYQIHSVRWYTIMEWEWNKLSDGIESVRM